jgi:mediator of RNA polymerase II transcription subunit 12
MIALEALLTHTTLVLYPAIVEHVFDVAIILSDHISDDVRIHIARLESTRATECPRSHFILGVAAPVDGWLVLTKPVNLPQSSPQPSTPNTAQNQASPYQSPHLNSSTPATPQQRYYNQQHQQRQQVQQAQQMRTYPQYPQQSIPPNRQLPAQLQRTPSYQSSSSPLQQMQHMQQMQGLAQQRASQPSPVHSQRSAPAAGQGGAGGPVGGTTALSKMQASHANQQKEMRQYPFVQPRWEILAESSGNPSLNETAINLSLFGARKV